MCGIVGFWNASAHSFSLIELDRFTDSLAHRGPDGRGTWSDENCSFHLGHRRLSVLDLSPLGTQPMSYGNGRYWIVHNGEIYNFLELRKELEGLGHSFRSDTDTEVILAAYAQWGPDCQYKLNGMWAFAIWDTNERQLFLSRDRYGVKPLLYMCSNRSFAFASELKAFIALPKFVRPEFEYKVMARMKNEPNQSRTILKDVYNLKGGHFLIYQSDGTPKISKWWETSDNLATPPKKFEDQVTEYKEMFFDACRIRMRSDVPLGTALSGGLDSSSVICTMAKIRADGSSIERLPRDWKKAFSLVYSGTSHDERYFADIVASETHTEISHKIVDPLSISPEDLESAIFSLEAIDNEPTIGPWLLYKEMRNAGVVVSLDGHGGDETLAGYENYPTVAMQDALWPIPSRDKWRDMQEVLAGIYRDGSPLSSFYRKPTVTDIILEGLSKYWQPRELVSTALNNYPTLSSQIRRIHSSVTRNNRSVAATNWLRIRPADYRPRVDYPTNDRVNKYDRLNRQLYFDTHQDILPRNLADFDRLSMAHGVEVRAPFMDWRLMCFVFSLPSESKIGNGYTKRILREAMREVLPEKIRTRRSKFGFASPMAEWYRTGLKEYVFDTLNSRSFLESNLWHGDRIKTFAEICYKNGEYQMATKTWKFIQADILQRKFIDATHAT
jgi:asparagine synthase (glutamine-hydrolysing)